MDHPQDHVLTPAIYALVRSLDAYTQQMKSDHDCQRVTKQDLKAAEDRIVAAIGERVDPKNLAKLVSELKSSAEPLKAAVKAAG